MIGDDAVMCGGLVNPVVGGFASSLITAHNDAHVVGMSKVRCLLTHHVEAHVLCLLPRSSEW
jgi:hypothetical protein